MLKSNLIDLYPHNKVVFDKVLENLKTHNKVGVVQATGTGKGKLAACFVEFLIYHKSNAKILIVAPLRSILENYKSNFNLEFNNIKYITYQKLNNLSDTDLEKIGKSCDLIILDEYHRCGATEWYKSIIKLFKSVDENKCKVVGLTATPIRYLDNSRDMSEELFNNNVIEGLNIEEAILDGILPGFVYNACYFGIETTLRDVENKLKNNEYKISSDVVRNDLMVKVKELNMLYQNRYKIERIIKENTVEIGKNQKWVIFCKDKESLYEIRKYCINWFNDTPDLYIINSDRQGLDNDRTLSEFRNAKEGTHVLLCVNMLNEGVHIKDLNGVIMLRKTDSPILFLQQLGRALEVGKGFNPIIFDLIGNYKGLKVKKDDIERTPIDIVKGIEKRTKNKKNYVIVHNFTEDMDKVLVEISSVINNIWTDYENDLLRKYYPVGGIELCQEKGLDYRPRGSIQQQAHRLGLTNNLAYSEEELDIIRNFFPIGGAKLCIEKGLKGRSIETIREKAKQMGLRYNKFVTEEEIKIIREFYPIGGVKLCQENGLYNRSASTITKVARKLGILIGNVPYTEEEVAIIQKYYPLGGAILCQENGVKRTLEQIKGKAHTLGLKMSDEARREISKEHKGFVSDLKYSDDELSIIIKYYPLGGAELCQEKGLSRSISGIKSKAKELKLSYNSNLYTDLELSILIKYFPIGGAELCQEKGLNRNIKAINSKAHSIGLSYNNKNYTDIERQIVEMYYPIGGAELCQEKGLNRTINSIRTYAKKYGLTGDYKNIGRTWNQSELDILYKYYPIGGVELCKKEGLTRTNSSIKGKAQTLGLVYSNNLFTEEEISIIKEFYPFGGPRLCIKNGLNKDEEQIRGKARNLGVSYNSHFYSDVEIALITEFYPIGGVKLCQEKGVNRSKAAITSMAGKLGLKYDNLYYTVEDIEIIKKYYPIGGTKLCIEKGLNKKPENIQKYASKLGIKFVGK